MRVTLDKKLVVHMGEYETLSFGAQVTVSHTDLGYPLESVFEDDEAQSEVTDAARAWLRELLRPDAEEAAALTRDRKSYILHAGLANEEGDN